MLVLSLVLALTAPPVVVAAVVVLVLGWRAAVSSADKVGMVRQNGYGNLQGFTGYRAGPHTITMGYANDASLPDANGGVSKTKALSS